MKKLICFIFSLAILCMLIPPYKTGFTKEWTTQELIEKFAIEYNIDYSTFKKVIMCESRANPKAIHYNDGGKGKHSVGVLQFQETTFNNWEKKLGEDLNYYSTYDQLKLGSFMWSKGQQNQWSCYKIIKSI